MRDATLAAMPWPSHLRVLLAVALAAMLASAATPPARGAVPRFGHVFFIVGENTSYEQITPRHAPFLTGTITQGAWVERSLRSPGPARWGSTSPWSPASSRAARRTTTSPTTATSARRACSPSSPPPALVAGLGGVDDQRLRPDRQRRGVGAQHLLGAPQPSALLHRPAGRQGRRGDRARRPVPHQRPPHGHDGPGRHVRLRRRAAVGSRRQPQLVVPNDCENGHDPCGTGDRIRQFDDFLAREVPKIEASPPSATDGTILITWDEGSDRRRTRATSCSPRSARSCDRVPWTRYATTTTDSSGPWQRASAWGPWPTRGRRPP